MNFEEKIKEFLLLKTELECQAAKETLHGVQRINIEFLKKAETERIQAEESLAENRLDRDRHKEFHRPSRDRWVEIGFDSGQDKWAARHSEVVAYGDTPEMACDNFDHLWVFGE